MTKHLKCGIQPVMRVVVLSSVKMPGILKRLQMLGHNVLTLMAHANCLEDILGLEDDSLDLVYLVSRFETDNPLWADIRVLLARASRYYVVYGKDLSTESIMNAARDGAHDVLDERDSDERWNAAIAHAASSQRLWWQLYGTHNKGPESRLAGRSTAMKALRESIQRIGPTDATVLVTGESGTGKERVSEAIHEASSRQGFVSVNCAAIPSELLESELFGVEKGAFTGANRDKRGLVEEASSGTLFLDEIGEMDIALQPKLLRFLETRKARRVGSTREYTCQARVITATNRDLQQESEKGRFRLDLYYRISEVVLHVPPLRHRSEDIPDLARLLIQAAAVRMGKNFETIEPELIYKFQLHSWPGNVRELKQAIDRLAIHYNGPVMRAAWWTPPRLPETPSPTVNAPQLPFGGWPFPANWQACSSPTVQPTPARAPFQTRRERIHAARELLESGNELSWVSAQLGIHPTTLYRWRKAGKV